MAMKGKQKIIEITLNPAVESTQIWWSIALNETQKKVPEESLDKRDQQNS